MTVRVHCPAPFPLFGMGEVIAGAAVGGSTSELRDSIKMEVRGMTRIMGPIRGERRGGG